MAHHPEYDWLEQYAAGTLPLPVALCVATHSSFCAECRRQIELLQSVGGALFEQLAPVPVADDLLQQVLDRIDTAVDAAPADIAADTVPVDVQDVPTPLRGLIPEGYEQLTWAPLLPRLRAASLRTGDPVFHAVVHRVQPGGNVPRHDHRGLEFTVVLRGSFSDELGVYGPGDFMLREPGVRHHPVAALHEECLCLTVQEAPIRFTGLPWRLLNPLLR
jgi:putative transcriptional regulator